MTIKTNSLELLDKLIHEVNSKCGSLKSAAGLLRKASPEETEELLELMAEQTESIARHIADFKQHLE